MITPGSSAQSPFHVGIGVKSSVGSGISGVAAGVLGISVIIGVQWSVLTNVLNGVLANVLGFSVELGVIEKFA